MAHVCEFGITYTTREVKKEVRQSVALFSVPAFEKELGALAERIVHDIAPARSAGGGAPAYTLSLVFAEESVTHTLNKTHRTKDYVPNVLSFPLSTTMGEIYITPSVATEEAAEYGHTPYEHLTYLFVHGLLHCLGLDHGKKMDALEKKYVQYTEKRVQK